MAGRAGSDNELKQIHEHIEMRNSNVGTVAVPNAWYVMQMQTPDLRPKSYFSRRSNPETLKFGIYAKNQSNSSIFVKLHFGPPDPRKITKWSSIFSKFSNWSSKYSTSPPSSQNSQINPLNILKLIYIPQFSKITIWPTSSSNLPFCHYVKLQISP